jgi:peptidoglycan/xylan/chitin deacetylase (PgdA/CDA1 family)
MNRADALRTIAAAFAQAPAGGVPVLMYHHVNDTNPTASIARGLTLPTEAFEAQLRWLVEHRVTTLTAAELVDTVERGQLPQRAAVLTFDDGYADTATIVAPLLQRYRARATFFVNAGTIGLRGHVTYRALRAMQAAGNEIGAHGMHHLDLATLDRQDQLREAGDCVERIARFTGVRPVSYAYASGAYNATTLALMPEIGIRSAWTEHSGRVRDLRDPYQMPRLRIARDTTIHEFAAMVAGRT